MLKASTARHLRLLYACQRVCIPSEQDCQKVSTAGAGTQIFKDSRVKGEISKKMGENRQDIQNMTDEAIPGFEPGSPDSKSGVINHYTKSPIPLTKTVFLILNIAKGQQSITAAKLVTQGRSQVQPCCTKHITRMVHTHSSLQGA